MLRSYIINCINAVILIAAGFAVYFLHPERPLEALIAPGFGIMLLACTNHLRKRNRFVTHTVTALTLLAAIVVIMRLNTADVNLSTIYVLMLAMGLSCLVTVGVFIGTFISERRLHNNTIYKEDL